MKKIIVSMLCASFCIPALAAEGRWTEGFGQGNLEYFIDKLGLRLYIGCPTEDGSADSPSSVSLYRINDNTDITKFTLLVNGITYDAPFEAVSRVEINNFTSLLENLRKGNAIVKFGSKSITFPRGNADKVIPVYGSKNFSCNLI